jgi:hypothetical protein
MRTNASDILNSLRSLAESLHSRGVVSLATLWQLDKLAPSLHYTLKEL